MNFSSFKKTTTFCVFTTASFFIVVLLFIGCKTEQGSANATITFANDSTIKLSGKAVSIGRGLIQNEDVNSGFPLLIYKADTIPSQINDLDGDGKWDELFLVIDFLPQEKKAVQLKWVKEALKYPIKTSVRFGKRNTKETPVKPALEETLFANQVPGNQGFQKYQTDGPTWENDKVGFRHYLDGRNSKDVFGKKMSAITPENVGVNSEGAVEDNYHEMHSWGRDVFPVGNSAGLGGYALLVNNDINRLGIIMGDTLNTIEKTTFKIMSEGPVNSVLTYNYNNWKASGNIYQVKETTSIWPGMYGYKNTVSVDGLKGKEILLIALSNINNQQPLNVVEVEDWVCIIQHDYLTYERQWIMGTAIIIPKKGYFGYIESPKEGQLTNSYLAKMKIENNEPISYYAIAAWELSEDKNFKDSTYFKNYVINLTKQLSKEITIQIKNLN